MTPKEVLSAKTPKGAAQRFHKWLTQQAAELGYKNTTIFLWSPEETKAHGFGSSWSVVWEEGPFEWTSISGGSTLYAGELGTYSTPGPFPQGLTTKTWYASPYNNFAMNFYST